MRYFMEIFYNNIIPLGIMILLGVGLQRAFRLDIKTLSKLNFYLFSPAIIFKSIYESRLSMQSISETLLFFVCYFTAHFILAQIVVWVRRYPKGMGSAMKNSILFYNSGNYALPLNQLVFTGNPLAQSVQILIMMMQNLLPYTYGIYSVNAHKQNWKQTLRTILSLPAIYVIALAWILKDAHIPIPHPIDSPIGFIANGFISVALITLGVQLGSMKWTLRMSDVLISIGMRLCIGPILGFAVVYLLGLHGILAQALVLSCAVPTSLNSVLLAVEFDNEPEFASQAMFASTVFSIVTVTIVIDLLKWI